MLSSRVKLFLYIFFKQPLSTLAGQKYPEKRHRWWKSPRVGTQLGEKFQSRGTSREKFKRRDTDGGKAQEYRHSWGEISRVETHLGEKSQIRDTIGGKVFSVYITFCKTYSQLPLTSCNGLCIMWPLPQATNCKVVSQFG